MLVAARATHRMSTPQRRIIRAEASGSGRGIPDPLWHGFGSDHAGGAQFVLGDGSVRFISENVDATTYSRLGTVSDGNTIGEFTETCVSTVDFVFPFSFLDQVESQKGQFHD